MKNVKAGDIVGIGTGPKEIGLYCKITKVEGGVIHFHVINGAWDGKLLPNGNLVVNAYPKNSHKGEIQYVMLPGEKVSGDYNSALHYMQEKATEQGSNVLRRIPVILKWRLCQLKQYFYQLRIWLSKKIAPKPARAIAGFEDDDSIPF